MEARRLKRDENMEGSPDLKKKRGSSRRDWGQAEAVSGHSVFFIPSLGFSLNPSLGLLITFVTATIPQTLHAAILFSCLCFYDFPKRTAPKIHKIWHLVNLINVRWPFATKKDKNSKLRCGISAGGEVFFMGSWRSNMLNMDAICRVCFELFGDNSDSWGCPSWGWAVIPWGCSPYPAHLLHPNKNIWRDWHPPARAHSQSMILIKKSFQLRLSTWKKGRITTIFIITLAVFLWPQSRCQSYNLAWFGTFLPSILEIEVDAKLLKGYEVQLWGSSLVGPGCLLAGISWNQLRKNTTIQVFPTKRCLRQTCV